MVLKTVLNLQLKGIVFLLSIILLKKIKGLVLLFKTNHNEKNPQLFYDIDNLNWGSTLRANKHFG